MNQKDLKMRIAQNVEGAEAGILVTECVFPSDNDRVGRKHRMAIC
jgi:hypothetical protein